MTSMAKTHEFRTRKIQNLPQSGMRHSSASYHLAQHKNTPAISLEVNHTKEVSKDSSQIAVPSV